VITSRILRMIKEGDAVEIFLRSDYIQDSESIMVDFEVANFTE